MCSGYRDQSSIIFRDETPRTLERAQRRQPQLASPHSKAASYTVSQFPELPIWVYRNCTTWKYPLSLAAEDLAICHFYHSTLENLSYLDPTRELQAELPGLYAKSGPGSALRLATEAISYASSIDLVQGATELSRKCYVRAARAARSALQDLNQARSHQTLYAILLLCGYEVGFFFHH